MQNYIDKLKLLPYVSILTTLIIILLFNHNVFKAIDNSFFDYFMILKNDNKASNEIVIIEIDTKSLDRIGRWPWKRSVYAELINKISAFNPGVIGINLLFVEPTEEDEIFIDSLKKLNNVVIPFAKDENNLLFPQQDIANNAVLADINIKRDKDGIVRHARKNSAYHNKFISFAATISNLFSPGIIARIPVGDYFYINYENKTKSFKHISFYDVLNKNIAPEVFKDKIVLIGTTAESISSNINIPLSNKVERSLTGVELQAHIINTIISGKFINKLDNFTLFILLLFITLLLELFLMFKKPFIQGITTIIFVASTSIVSYLFFSITLIWLPPSIFLISFIVIYLVYAFKTLIKIDKTVDKAITELSSDNYIPLADISNQVEKGVLTLSELSQVINKDREMIKAILDAINSPVLVVEKDSKIIWKNNQVETIDKLNNLNNLNEIDVNFDDLKSAVKADNIYKEELMIDDKDYLLISTPSDTKKTNFVCIFNDITELKNLDRLKTDLMRTVSHEIRTPLTIIQSYCDLGVEMEDGNVAIDYLAKISNKTEELTELVSDFLDLNKLEANMVELNFSQLNVTDFIVNLVAEMKELASQKSINIINQFNDNEEIMINADLNRLKQVFINLLSNAIKYSRENTSIKVIVETLDNNVTVSIADEGFGMSKEDTEKIFDKFYRVNSEDTSDISGTGLGLAIVKKIVEIHHGSISVESELGKGSIFKVSLPVNTDNEKT